MTKKEKPAYFLRNTLVLGVKMVGPRRFELLTFCTPSRRATSLRYGPILNESAGTLSTALLTVKA
jgi:hypothetical protein